MTQEMNAMLDELARMQPGLSCKASRDTLSEPDGTGILAWREGMAGLIRFADWDSPTDPDGEDTEWSLDVHVYPTARPVTGASVPDDAEEALAVFGEDEERSETLCFDGTDMPYRICQLAHDLLRAAGNPAPPSPSPDAPPPGIGI